MSFAKVSRLVLVLGILVTGLFESPVAHACGGFFCSQATPVNQSAEQIIFSKNTDGTVTAVISIQYQGDAQRFAWVLPIAGVPTVGVSSNLAFQRLLAATSPSYSLSTRVEGTCRVRNFDDDNFNGSGGSGGMGNTGGSTSGPPPVTIVSEGSVGPYDFVAIAVSQDQSDPARVALDWLSENQYDVSAFGEDVLGTYLEDGLNLLAFRLTKGNSVGSIRPIRVTYPATYPAIPIRPTAVAANDDMGVLVYMIAEHQAIPKNYMALVLNEALINWFNFAPSYNAVINRAADEAGGQGFVTEFGGASTRFNGTIFSSGDLETWNLVTSFDPLPSEIVRFEGWELFNLVTSFYGSWDGYREAIAAAITLPEEITLDAFFDAPFMYTTDTRIAIDPLKLLTALQEQVIDPMIETQELIVSRPYLTRLFTTMSAEEMTVDPLFSINPDLIDISNTHTAEQVIECSPSVDVFEAPWRIHLPQGGVVRGRGNSGWPFSTNDAMPANRKIVQLSENGSGEVITDNSRLIWAALGSSTVLPNPTGGSAGSGNVPIGGFDPVIPDEKASDGGCTLGGMQDDAASKSLLVLLATFAALGRRRVSKESRVGLS